MVFRGSIKLLPKGHFLIVLLMGMLRGTLVSAFFNTSLNGSFQDVSSYTPNIGCYPGAANKDGRCVDILQRRTMSTTLYNYTIGNQIPVDPFDDILDPQNQLSRILECLKSYTMLICSLDYETFLSNLDFQELLKEEHDYRESIFSYLEQDMMNKIYSINKEKYLILLCDVTCIIQFMAWANNIDQTLNQNGYYTISTKWIVIFTTDNPNISSHISALEKQLQNISNIFIIAMIQNEKGKARLEFFTGEWVVQGRVVSPLPLPDGILTTNDIFPSEKYGLNGRLLTVSMLPWLKYFEYNLSSDGSMVYNNGKYWKACEVLMHKLNFSLKLIEPKDGEWGMFRNNNWTGIVKDLKDKNADISASLTTNVLRREVIDFSIPLDHDDTYFVYRRPLSNSSQYFEFWKPLKSTVWVIILMSGALIGILMWKAGYLLGVVSAPLDRAGHMFLHVIGPLCAKGSQQWPAHTSVRILYMGWFYFCIIIGAVYTGTLTASYAVVQVLLPVENVNELYEHGGYQYGLTGGTVSELILKMASPDSLLRKMYTKMEENHANGKDVLGIDYDRQIQKVVDEPFFALLLEWSGIRTIAFDNPEIDFILLSDQNRVIYISMVCFGFQKNSALKAMFSERIMQIRENGLLERWDREIFTSEKLTNLFKKSFWQISKRHVISMNDISVALTFIAAMLGIAFLVLTCENVIYKKLLSINQCRLIKVNLGSENTCQQT